jgi:hypothetical protein
MANAVKRSPATQDLHHNVDLSQYSSSGKPTQGAGSSSQCGTVEKSTWVRNSPVVRNLSRSPPRKPPHLGYYQRELAIVANLCREVTFKLRASKGRQASSGKAK